MRRSSYYLPIIFLFLVSFVKSQNQPIQTVSVTNVQSVIPIANLTASRYIFQSNKTYTLRLAVHNGDTNFSSCSLIQGDSPQGIRLLSLYALSEGAIAVLSYTTTITCPQETYAEAYLIAISLPSSIDARSLWYVRLGSPISVDIGANYATATENYPVYFTTYCPGGCVEYLERVNQTIQTNATFTIQAGLPGNMYSLTSFGVDDATKNLPQEVRGDFKTYILNSGVVSILIDKSSTAWSTVSSERAGFFMTSTYPFPSRSQSAITTLSSTDLMLYSFTIMEMQVGGSGGNFSVEIEYKDNKGYSMVLLETNVDMEYTANPQTGYKMEFELNQGKEISKGGLVRFNIQNSASSVGLYLLLVTLIFSV